MNIGRQHEKFRSSLFKGLRIPKAGPYSVIFAFGELNCVAVIMSAANNKVLPAGQVLIFASRVILRFAQLQRRIKYNFAAKPQNITVPKGQYNCRHRWQYNLIVAAAGETLESHKAQEGSGNSPVDCFRAGNPRTGVPRRASAIFVVFRFCGMRGDDPSVAFGDSSPFRGAQASEIKNVLLRATEVKPDVGEDACILPSVRGKHAVLRERNAFFHLGHGCAETAPPEGN